MNKENKEMTGAEMVIEALGDQGVEHLFGYPGGAVLPIYDALFQQSNRLQHILVRHEQGAVHAAEGYARSTGKVGCVLVTSGPGATNAVTGLTDAFCDSIPIVCITGQVPTHLIGNDAFQECDTVGITRPCTKYNYLVKSIADLPGVLHEAFHIAKSGRPGPVVIDIPKDVQFATGTYSRRRRSRTRLQAEGQGRPRQDRGRARLDGECQTAVVLHRRRHHQCRPARKPLAARARQAHRAFRSPRP
jgi:acetolactate synthase-1/2/3 large subunit